MKLISKIVLLFILMISLTGCAAVVVGGAAGAYSYVKGWMAVDYNVNLTKGYRASLKALRHHDLRIIEKEKDITIAFIKARGAKREIRIRLKRKAKRITKISIRFGVLGDRKASRMVHDTISSFL
ncbi:MAG: DUF3568 family protein [bacterium]|nr:DUF3568 family protein [bacterium]